MEYSDNEKISEFSMQFDNGNNIKMTCISTTDFSKIYEAALAIKSRYNPSILRYLRKDILILAWW